MKKELNRRRRGTEEGFTLVETLVGGLIISLLALVVFQLFAVDAALLALSSLHRDADAEATGCVSRVAALKPADNSRSLTWNTADRTVAVWELVPGYYDFVVYPGENNKVDLPEGCNGWPCAVDPTKIPDGAEILFLRCWTVATMDPLRNVRVVRIGVFPRTALESGPPEPSIVQGTEALAAYEANVNFK